MVGKFNYKIDRPIFLEKWLLHIVFSIIFTIEMIIFIYKLFINLAFITTLNIFQIINNLLRISILNINQSSII